MDFKVEKSIHPNICIGYKKNVSQSLISFYCCIISPSSDCNWFRNIVKQMTTGIVFWLLLGLTAESIGQLYTDDVSDGRCTLNPVAKNFTSCLNVCGKKR